MKKFRCSFCGTNQADGYMFDRLTLRICGSCRGYTLAGLAHCGVPLTEANPFVAELCVSSHTLESAWWEFYNPLTQTKGIVVKTCRASDRPGLIRVKSDHPNTVPFYVER